PLPPQSPLRPRDPGSSAAARPSAPAGPVGAPGTGRPPLPPYTIPAPASPRLASTPPPMSPQASGPAADIPIRGQNITTPFFPALSQEERPTLAKRGDSSVATVRQLIDTVEVQRLTLTVERENGQIVQRTVIHDGDLCRIGTHGSNELVLADPAVSRFH